MNNDNAFCVQKSPALAPVGPRLLLVVILV